LETVSDSENLLSAIFPIHIAAKLVALWKLRNDAVHAFLTGPYNLMHVVATFT
jgi:hypothetical protein